jgi:addiction module RelE/StbE family toxin
MAYRLRYRPKAVEQLDAIFTYIATRNRPAAHRVMGAIKRRIEQLADFPYSSRPSEVPGIRELPIARYPYIVFYAVDDRAQEIHILRVRHTSQDPSHHLD